jgi:hypothetical protein
VFHPCFSSSKKKGGEGVKEELKNESDRKLKRKILR